MSTPKEAEAPKQANGNTKAIEKVRPMDQLKRDFELWKPTLKAILPRHIDPERVIKIAMNVYLHKPELQACTPLSMVRATLQCAELGLDPSPLLKESWFIPFENKKKVKDGNVWKEAKVLEVQLMPGYVGLIKLAKQTGDITDVYAVAVDECEKDPEYFYVERGTVNRIFHKVRLDAERTGNLFACYGVVKFKDSTYHFEVMSKQEVDAIRKRSKAADNGPWVTDYIQMAKKTLIKQALKTVPLSPEKQFKLAQAIAADNAAETGEAFSSELTEAIDTEGVEVVDSPAAQPSRTQELAQKISHDPVTGEVREMFEAIGAVKK